MTRRINGFNQSIDHTNGRLIDRLINRSCPHGAAYLDFCVWLVVHRFLSSCSCHCVCTDLPRKPDQMVVNPTDVHVLVMKSVFENSSNNLLAILLHTSYLIPIIGPPPLETVKYFFGEFLQNDESWTVFTCDKLSIPGI